MNSPSRLLHMNISVTVRWAARGQKMARVVMVQWKCSTQSRDKTEAWTRWDSGSKCNKCDCKKNPKINGNHVEWCWYHVTVIELIWREWWDHFKERSDHCHYKILNLKQIFSQPQVNLNQNKMHPLNAILFFVLLLSHQRIFVGLLI